MLIKRGYWGPIQVVTLTRPGTASYPGYFRYAREDRVGAAGDLLTWPRQKKIGGEGKVFYVNSCLISRIQYLFYYTFSAEQMNKLNCRILNLVIIFGIYTRCQQINFLKQSKFELNSRPWISNLLDKNKSGRKFLSQ